MKIDVHLAVACDVYDVVFLCCPFFPRDILDEIFNSIVSVFARSLNEFCNRWCKREHVECDALKDWKLNIFKIIDQRISFYSQNTDMLPRKPKISYRYLKSGNEDFHRKYVLVPADKAANNVVVV